MKSEIKASRLQELADLFENNKARQNDYNEFFMIMIELGMKDSVFEVLRNNGFSGLVGFLVGIENAGHPVAHGLVRASFCGMARASGVHVVKNFHMLSLEEKIDGLHRKLADLELEVAVLSGPPAWESTVGATDNRLAIERCIRDIRAAKNTFIIGQNYEISAKLRDAEIIMFDIEDELKKTRHV